MEMEDYLASQIFVMVELYYNSFDDVLWILNWWGCGI